MINSTIILMVLSTLLIACGTKEKEDITAGWSAEQLYRSAKAEMADGNYQTAIEQYEILLSIWSSSDPGIAEKADAEERLARLKAGS